jgi:MFS family permease
VFLQLFSPQLKVTTCLLWTFFFANAFTYYGLVLLTTELPIKEHEKSFVAASGCLPDGRPGTDVSSYKAVLITALAELPGLVIACLIVDWFGRKASMGVLLLGCGLFVIPLWTPLSQTVTTTLMFGARSCIMGAFSILWAFAPELYPTNARTTGLGFCNAGGRVGGFFCPFVAVEMMKNNHRVSLFFPFLSSFSSLGSVTSAPSNAENQYCNVILFGSGHLYLSCMWLSVAPRTDTRKTCV